MPPLPLARPPRTLAFALAAVALAAGALVAHAFTVRLAPRTAAGVAADARTRFSTLEGGYYPGVRDTGLLAHDANSTCYFYPNGVAPLTAAAGTYRLEAWRGPEWRPFEQLVTIRSDTTLAYTLSRFIDLRPRGWYAGDLHVHTEHPPIDFAVRDDQAARAARGEGLAVLQLLDQASRFTGSASAVSDSLLTLYHSYEYRNQTGGHAVLPGLVSPVGDGCCLEPAPPWPMLHDLHAPLAAQGALLVLAHPNTTGDYESRLAWPGAGLGRELGVLGALGSLDAVDVLSYSNLPYADWADWYALLSAGLDIPATAGTDAVLNWYFHLPAGGFRVYANVAPGPGSLYARWVAAVRAGRTFVTSAPLVPRFEFAGVGPGGAFDAPNDTLVRPLRIEAACVLGLGKLSVIADGAAIHTLEGGGRTTIDTTITIRCPTPRWVALRVDGAATHPVMLGLPVVAHTSAVRITLRGARRPLAAGCARLWDDVQRYADLVATDGTALRPWQRDSIAARVARAQAFYAAPFRSQPGIFLQLESHPGAVAQFAWSRSRDPDAADRVRYEVQADTLLNFSTPQRVMVEDTVATLALPPAHQPWWWRVFAIDRAGNWQPAFNAPLVVQGTNLADAPAAGAAPSPLAYPNPARGAVRLSGFAPDVGVYDLAGRRLAWPGHGLERDADGFRWERGGGRPAPPGLYFVRSSTSGVLRVVVLD